MNSRERNLVNVAAMVAVFVLAFLFFLDPMLKGRREVREDIRKAERRLESLEKDGLGSSEGRELARLRGMVGVGREGQAETQSTRILRSVENACIQAQALPLNIVPLDSTEESGLIRHPVEVQAKGTLQAVFQMLANLSEVRPAVGIERLNMEYDEKSDLLTVQLVVASFTPKAHTEAGGKPSAKS